MSTIEVIASCDCCGADGPLDSQDYCAVCAAKLLGWNLGQRTQALMAVGDAVMAARMQECTAGQVLAFVSDVLAEGHDPRCFDSAIALVDSPPA